MDWFVTAFLKASLAWLALGVTLGVAMAIHPPWTVYRLAHVHMVLLGFVTMMIYGVAYHVIPRFAGSPLRSRRVALVHWWMANIGLAGMASGFAWRVWHPTSGTWLLSAGGTLSAVGAYLFVWQIWATLDGPRRLRASAQRAMDAGLVRSAKLPLHHDA
jgi:cbb3-type cytochrome oxidase subunit 1